MKDNGLNKSDIFTRQINSKNEDGANVFNTNFEIGGNGQNEDLGEKATEHNFSYTALRYPKKGAVTYIQSAMSQIYLNSPAYSLHKERSIWMNHEGAIGLLCGNFVKINGGYRWVHGHIIQWTKAGALKIGDRVLIKIRVLLIPEEFRGATAVELNGDICLKFVPGRLQ